MKEKNKKTDTLRMTFSKSVSTPLSVSRRKNSGWSLKAAVALKTAHLFVKTWFICEQDQNVRIKDGDSEDRTMCQTIHLGLTLVLTFSGRPSMGDE
jgi:hypothetical protein